MDDLDFLWRMERDHMTDYLTEADQNSPDGHGNTAFLGAAGTAIQLGIKPI